MISFHRGLLLLFAICVWLCACDDVTSKAEFVVVDGGQPQDTASVPDLDGPRDSMIEEPESVLSDTVEDLSVPEDLAIEDTEPQDAIEDVTSDGSEPLDALEMDVFDEDLVIGDIQPQDTPALHLLESE